MKCDDGREKFEARHIQTLVLTLRNEDLLSSSGQQLRHVAQWLRRLAQWLEKLLAVIQKFLDVLAAPRNTVDFWIGHLALRRVFARGFSQVFAGLRFIQNVVNHLKHQSHGFAPARQAIKRVGIGVRGVGAHAARGADQRASFLAVD